MQQDIAAVVAEFEQRYSLLREHLLLAEQSFLKGMKKLRKELEQIRKKIASIEQEVRKLREICNHLLSQTENYAPIEQLKALQQQLMLLEPLELVTKKDVEKIAKKVVREEVEKHIKKDEQISK